MNHFFKKKTLQLGLPGTCKNNNYTCLLYRANIWLYSGIEARSCEHNSWQLFWLFFITLSRNFCCMSWDHLFLSLSELLMLCWGPVSGFQNTMLLLMNLIKHHAWQSKKLTLWKPGGYRFNFSWISRTTIILANNVPQSWGRESSALILSLPQLTWLSSHTDYPTSLSSSGKNKPE